MNNDKTRENINKGKGLPPIISNDPKQGSSKGVVGIHYETAEVHEKEGNESGN